MSLTGTGTRVFCCPRVVYFKLYVHLRHLVANEPRNNRYTPEYNIETVHLIPILQCPIIGKLPRVNRACFLLFCFFPFVRRVNWQGVSVRGIQVRSSADMQGDAPPDGHAGGLGNPGPEGGRDWQADDEIRSTVHHEQATSVLFGS